MIQTLKRASYLTAAVITLSLSSCKKEDNTKTEEPLNVPMTYAFERDGSSSVSYSGQTERLNQLVEMTNKLGEADGGNTIDAQVLIDMFENANGDGNGNFSFTSTKQLKDKTFHVDVNYFETLLSDAAANSVDGSNGVVAANGTAGLISRSNGKSILVSAGGFEYNELFEKGLMGATFFYQIGNVYLSDDKIGPAVDNETMVTGKNYTAMEHHWDEAFGYFGAPVDFSSAYAGTGSPAFWAKYSKTHDAVLGCSDNLMVAFKTGRAAITAKKPNIAYEQRVILAEGFQQLAAACAISYANKAKAITDQGDLLHVLSECYGFTRALRYANPMYSKMGIPEVDALLMDTFEDNLWEVSVLDLNQLIDQLATHFDLEDVKTKL